MASEPLRIGGARDAGARAARSLAESAEWQERLKSCDGCDACGDRCVEGFQVTQAEYRRMRDFWSRLPEETRRRVGGKPREMPWPGVPEVTYTACRFRDPERRQCAIYPARPLVCRLFGHAEWLPCPIGRIPSPAKEARRLLEDYCREGRRTFAEWEALEEDA